MSQRHDIDDLNTLYTDGESADSEVFSEMRSNILLISGEHYTRKNSRYWNRIRDTKDLTNDQKLRLTKNHIQKITKTYINNIVSHAPSVTIVPKNEKERQDQKAAELNKSVWEDVRNTHNLRLKTQLYVKDFIELGECAVKIFWNPNGGKFLGWEPETDETGKPVMDEQGQMVQSKTPAFSGDLEIERIFAFNMIRDSAAKSMDESRFLCLRKMVDIEDLKSMVEGDEEKLKMIVESQDDTFMVFDGNNQNYTKTKNQTMIREFYFKSCPQYPMGYFYICVQGGILFEGELPFGIFPICYAGFDEIQTSARHRSIVKQLRPYQAEINRAASKMAEHQITLGDDKLLIQSGTKVTNGGQLPGVRALQYQGMAPTILQGRSGDQYLSYQTSQIAEMYSVANLAEDSEQKQVAQTDPWGFLFLSLRDKKKFSIYSDKIESFLRDICKLCLELAREYYPDDRLIPAIGRNEFVNISEFRSSAPLSYKITLEAQVDDPEEIMGRTLTMNHILQFVGGQLGKEDIGKIIRTYKFGNVEESFSDFTLDYDNVTNMILALDRGEQVAPQKYEDPKYVIKKLTGRIRQADFSMLAPQIQQNYMMLKQAYEQMEVDNQRSILAAQADFIPTDGPRIKVDFYVDVEGKVQRATLPSRAVEWLIQRLADQGQSQDALSTLGSGNLAEMAGMLQQNQQGGSLQGGNVSPIRGGQMPQGV